MWYPFNGLIITIVLGLLGIFIFGKLVGNKHFQLNAYFFYIGSNKPETVDASLLVCWKDVFPCWRSTKVNDICSISFDLLCFLFLFFRKLPTEQYHMKAKIFLWII